MPRGFNNPVAKAKACLAADERVLVLAKLAAQYNVSLYRDDSNQEQVTPHYVVDHISKLRSILDRLRSGRLVEADPKQLERESVGLEKSIYKQLEAWPVSVRQMRDNCWLHVHSARDQALSCWRRAEEHLASPASEHRSLNNSIRDLSEQCAGEFEGQVSRGDLSPTTARREMGQLRELVSLRAGWDAVVSRCRAELTATLQGELSTTLGRLRLILFIYRVGSWARIRLPDTFDGARVNQDVLLYEAAEVSEVLKRARTEQDNLPGAWIGASYEWAQDLEVKIYTDLKTSRRLAQLRDAGWKDLGEDIFDGREARVPVGGRPSDILDSDEALRRRADPDRALSPAELDKLVREAKDIQREWAHVSTWPMRPEAMAGDVQKELAALSQLSQRRQRWKNERHAALAAARARVSAAAQSAPPPGYDSSDAHTPQPRQPVRHDVTSHLRQLGLHDDDDDRSDTEPPPRYTLHAYDSLRRGRAQLELVTPRRARMYQL